MHSLKFHLGHLGIFALFVILVSLATMLLWNAIMPDLFSLPALGFFQAMGLLALSRLLLGGLSHMWDHIAHRNPEERKFHWLWHHMNREQRAEFIKSRYHFFRGGGAAENKTENKETPSDVSR